MDVIRDVIHPFSKLYGKYVRMKTVDRLSHRHGFNMHGFHNNLKLTKGQPCSQQNSKKGMLRAFWSIPAFPQRSYIYFFGALRRRKRPLTSLQYVVCVTEVREKVTLKPYRRTIRNRL